MWVEMPATDSDMTLLRAYAEGGDAGAFAELVRRHTTLVFATCLRTLGDRQRAEDAAQETFYRLMREPRRVRRSVAGYLHQVATRLCLDVLRSESARSKRERRYGEQLEADRRQRDPQWAEVVPHVDDALLALPEATRQLLIEHFLEGRPQRQMARAAGVSPATMCRRMELAMEALRVEMRKRGVTLGALAMVGLLSAEAKAAAPAGLGIRLGQLAMLSGPKASAGASGLGVAGKYVLAGGALAGMTGVAAALLLVVVAMMPEPTVRTSRVMELDVAESLSPSTTVRPAAAAAETGGPYLVIDADPSPGEADRVHLVQTPAAGRTHLSVAFADGHVQSLPLDEVRQRVQRQTGRSFDDVAKTAPRIDWP